MQLKYNRQPSLGSSLIKIFIKLLVVIVIFILAIFLIEKINFPKLVTVSLIKKVECQKGFIKVLIVVTVQKTKKNM